MDLEPGYAGRLAVWSDIQGHLPYLREMAGRKPGQTVIELGIRSGNSTAAFLAGLDGGDLWSCDTGWPEVPEGWLDLPQWHLLIGDDVSPAVLEVMPARCDVLFIDTSHTYEQTLAELDAYMPRVAPGGVALFHDTQLDAAAGEQFGAVGHALTFWCAQHGVAWVNREGYYGLGVIEVPVAAVTR